jgi:hypothetical protein
MCFLLFLSLFFFKIYKIFSPFFGLYTPGGGAYITDSNLSRDTLAFFFKFFHLFNETLLPSRYTFSTYEAQNEREMNARLFPDKSLLLLKEKGGSCWWQTPRSCMRGQSSSSSSSSSSALYYHHYTHIHTYLWLGRNV